MTSVLRWFRRPNGSPNWMVVGPYVGIALIAGLIWQDGRANDQRERETRSRETAIIADAVAVNGYLIGLYRHDDCVLRVDQNNSMRDQFLAVNDVINDTGLPIPGLDVLLGRLVVSLDENTPEQFVADCPAAPDRPILSSPGVSLPD